MSPEATPASMKMLAFRAIGISSLQAFSREATQFPINVAVGEAAGGAWLRAGRASRSFRYGFRKGAERQSSRHRLFGNCVASLENARGLQNARKLLIRNIFMLAGVASGDMARTVPAKPYDGNNAIMMAWYGLRCS